jgi:hypothetical protein
MRMRGAGPQRGQLGRLAMRRRRRAPVRPSKVTSVPPTSAPSSSASARSTCAAATTPTTAVGCVLSRHVLEQAPVAGPTRGPDREHGAHPSHRRRVHHRYAREPARVRREELGREVVGPLEHHVGRPREGHCVLRQQARGVKHDLDPRDPRPKRPGRGVQLGAAHVGLAEEDLPVQVGRVHLVVVAQRDRSHAGVRQRHQRRAPQAADAHHQHASAFESALSLSSSMRRSLTPHGRTPRG